MQKINLQVLKSKVPKVYKNKKLNSANYGNFNHNDYQVFLHLVSKMGKANELGKYLQSEQLRREYILTAKEFSETFNVSLSHCYRALKKAADKLMKTDITVEKAELKEIWRINVCSMAKYNKKEGSISIKFTDDIMPYLAQVKQRFILYNLKEIANFGSQKGLIFSTVALAFISILVPTVGRIADKIGNEKLLFIASITSPGSNPAAFPGESSSTSITVTSLLTR